MIFTGQAPWLPLSEHMTGRFFDAFGAPIDGLPAIEGRPYPIGGPSVNPVRRKQPNEFIATGLAGIDLNNSLVSVQKIPFFADPDQPHNQVLAPIALRAKVDKIILGGMGLTGDDYLFFKHTFEKGYGQSKIIGFINTTDKSPIEMLLIPDMALAAAEYYAVEKKEKVLVLLTDMTQYVDLIRIEFIHNAIRFI